MKKELKVVFSTRARQDILTAYEFYEASQRDLGDYFNLQLKACVTSILKVPEGFKIIHKDFRQIKLKKFPYVIIYSVNIDEIVITKIFHTSLNPKKKFK